MTAFMLSVTKRFEHSIILCPVILVCVDVVMTTVVGVCIYVDVRMTFGFLNTCYCSFIATQWLRGMHGSKG